MGDSSFWRSGTGRVVVCQLVAYLVFATHVLSVLHESCGGGNGGGASGELSASFAHPAPSATTANDEGVTTAVAADSSPSSFRRGPEKLHLLHIWERTGEALSACEGRTRRPSSGTSSSLAFVREFFVAGAESSSGPRFNRTEELMRANRITASNNPCGIFAFVVEDERHAEPLRRLHEETGANVRVYWSPGGTSFDRIFLAARLSSNPGGLFVTSTADVALPPMDGPLQTSCATGLRRRDRPVLFVMSRRDVFLDDTDNCQIYNQEGLCVFPRIKTCEEYRDKYRSWDVFFGRTSLITDAVLERTWYAPSYWGAENVAAKVLAGNAADVYNLCPYVDVVHFHNVPRKGNSRARIFIRGVDGKAANAISNTEGDVSSVCNVEELSKLERLQEEYTWNR